MRNYQFPVTTQTIPVESDKIRIHFKTETQQFLSIDVEILRSGLSIQDLDDIIAMLNLAKQYATKALPEVKQL